MAGGRGGFCELSDRGAGELGRGDTVEDRDWGYYGRGGGGAGGRGGDCVDGN